jgi:Domain of unknown function (DUF4149)
MSRPGVSAASLLEACVLATWLGAALFFAGAVAPAAFDVLPGPGLAGSLVGRLLPPLFVAGAACGVAVLAIELRWPRAGWRLRAGGATVMISACLVAQFVIGSQIARLRAAIDRPIAELAPDDARRNAFGRLHGMSVAGLGAAMLAAAAVVAGAARGSPGRGAERGT